MTDKIDVKDVEIIEFVHGARGVEYDPDEKCFWWHCPRKRTAVIEIAAGGGGGGGSARGGDSGSGGKAGEYKFCAAELLPGRYRVFVGQGGRGGLMFGKPHADKPEERAQSGGDSRVVHETGLPVAYARGGEAGQLGGGPDRLPGSGTDGEDLVFQGNLIARGGRGGAPDQPGGSGQAPGAGGGGSGTFGGINGPFSGAGGNGKVRITLV